MMDESIMANSNTFKRFLVWLDRPTAEAFIGIREAANAEELISRVASQYKTIKAGQFVLSHPIVQELTKESIKENFAIIPRSMMQ